MMAALNKCLRLIAAMIPALAIFMVGPIRMAPAAPSRPARNVEAIAELRPGASAGGYAACGVFWSAPNGDSSFIVASAKGGTIEEWDIARKMMKRSWAYRVFENASASSDHAPSSTLSIAANSLAEPGRGSSANKVNAPPPVAMASAGHYLFMAFDSPPVVQVYDLAKHSLAAQFGHEDLHKPAGLAVIKFREDYMIFVPDNPGSNVAPGKAKAAGHRIRQFRATPAGNALEVLRVRSFAGGAGEATFPEIGGVLADPPMNAIWASDVSRKCLRRYDQAGFIKESEIGWNVFNSAPRLLAIVPDAKSRAGGWLLIEEETASDSSILHAFSRDGKERLGAIQLTGRAGSGAGAKALSFIETNLAPKEMEDAVKSGYFLISKGTGQSIEFYSRRSIIQALPLPLGSDLAASHRKLRFLQITDLHMTSQYAPNGEARLQQIVEKMAPLAPAADFVAVTGDFTMNGDEIGYSQAARTLARLPATVLACPGNHDSYKSNYENYFGAGNYSLDLKGYHLIFLDARDPTDYPDGDVMPNTYQFLQQDLKAAEPEQLILLFLHLPLAGKISLRNKSSVFQLLQGRKVPGVFHGHLHRNERVSEPWPGCKLQIGTMSSSYPRDLTKKNQVGFRLVEIEGEEIRTQWIPVLEWPSGELIQALSAPKNTPK